MTSGDWLPQLLVVLDVMQRELLALLAVLGLVPEVHGQPAWPFSERIAVEVLAFDRALARSVVVSFLLASWALVLVLVGALWKRARWLAWCLGAGLLVLAPWPSPRWILAPAVPTSFHRSTAGFSPETIAQGEGLYREHCVACHGNEARGDGVRAASLVMWPPDLTGALLWRRMDGELLWHVLHGMRDRRQRETMPGFVDRLGADDGWMLLDFLHALAAGETLRRAGAWEWPVRLPDATVHCDDGAIRTLSSWESQRVRIVAARENDEPVREDPRLVTIVLSEHAPPPALEGECRSHDARTWNAFARIAGVPPAELAGMRFLADRRGWLRARSAAGQSDWNDGDLICRSSAPSAEPAPQQDRLSGLDALIARMDAQPVRFTKGGVPH